MISNPRDVVACCDIAGRAAMYDLGGIDTQGTGCAVAGTQAFFGTRFIPFFELVKSKKIY